MKGLLFAALLIGFYACSKNANYNDYQEPTPRVIPKPEYVALTVLDSTFLLNQAFAFDKQIGGLYPNAVSFSDYTITCQDSIGTSFEMNWSMSDSFPPCPFSVYVNVGLILIPSISYNYWSSYPIQNGTSFTLTFSKCDNSGLKATINGTVDYNNDTSNKLPIVGSLIVP